MQKRRKMLTWLLTMMMALGLFGAQASIAGAAVSMDFYGYTVSPSELSASDKVLCDAKTFRAKVVDEKGNPVEGVNVNIFGVEDNTLDYNIKSDKNGIASYTLTGVDFMMPFDVSVSDANWTSEDEHRFETDGEPTKMPSIVSVDGKSLAEAAEVIFTVKKDKVLCEGRTFRAKVVDEKGTPVEGVSVLIKDNENQGCEYTVTSGKDGVVSHEMNPNADFDLTFNVNVKDSAWTSENTHTFVTGRKGDASITKVNGKAPADADEMVFVVKKGGTPAPSKVLSDSTHFRAVAVDKNGKPVAGAVFTVKVPGVGTHEITSNEKGVIEYALAKEDDCNNTLTVELKANDKWASMDSYKVVTNEMAEIDTVNKKPLSDEEFIFILHEKVDKTALGEALDKVKNLVKTDYTDESWSDYSLVLDKAQKVYDNDYVTKDDVTNAIQELEAAVKKLTVKAADTAKADDAKADAAKLQKDNYTPESWKAVEDALAELEKVSKGENVLQSELDAAVEKLTQAISDLKEAEKPEVDKTALGEALDKVKNLVKTDYTDESWSDYSLVLDKAQKVYDNDYVTKDDVTNAIQELEAAVKKLTVKAADTAKADDAKADAAKLQKDNYTPESWKAVEDALAELEKVSKGENVLQSELDAAVEKLTQAISDLKEAEKPEPEAKKVTSVKLSTTTYTYNGKVKKPAVIAKDNKNNVIPKSAYTV